MTISKKFEITIYTSATTYRFNQCRDLVMRGRGDTIQFDYVSAADVNIKRSSFDLRENAGVIGTSIYPPPKNGDIKVE